MREFIKFFGRRKVKGRIVIEFVERRLRYLWGECRCEVSFLENRFGEFMEVRSNI